MNLRTFFNKYYREFNNSINAGDRSRCLEIIEEMSLEDTGYHWKGMVLKFLMHFSEEIPGQIHNAMMLSENDERLKEYVAIISNRA